MKYLTILLLFFITLQPLVVAQTFELEGSLEHIRYGTVSLIHIISPMKDTLASATIEDGKFYLKGIYPDSSSTTVSVMMFQAIGDAGSSFSGVCFIEKDKKTSVQQTTKKNLFFSGTPKMEQLNEVLQYIILKEKELTVHLEKDLVPVDSVNQIKYELSETVISFLEKHEKDDLLEPSLAFLLSLIDSNVFNGDKLEYIEQLVRRIANHSFLAQQGLMLIQGKKATQKGAFAPNFNIEDFTLNDYQGKIVLLVFWATWCGPCIESINDLKEFYHSYHNKGLNIVGLSLDNQEEAHKKAIKKYQLPWQNFIDYSEEDKSIYKKYAANSIPYYVLINPQGKIEEVSSKITHIKQALQKLMAD